MENNKLSDLYFNKIIKHIDKVSKEMDLYYRFKNNIILSQSGGAAVAAVAETPAATATAPDVLEMLNPVTGIVSLARTVTRYAAPTAKTYNDCIGSYSHFLVNYITLSKSAIRPAQLEILSITMLTINKDFVRKIQLKTDARAQTELEKKKDYNYDNDSTITLYNNIIQHYNDAMTKIQNHITSEKVENDIQNIIILYTELLSKYTDTSSDSNTIIDECLRDFTDSVTSSIKSLYIKVNNYQNEKIFLKKIINLDFLDIQIENTLKSNLSKKIDINFDDTNFNIILHLLGIYNYKSITLKYTDITNLIEFNEITTNQITLEEFTNCKTLVTPISVTGTVYQNYVKYNIHAYDSYVVYINNLRAALRN